MSSIWMLWPFQQEHVLETAHSNREGSLNEQWVPSSLDSWVAEHLTTLADTLLMDVYCLRAEEQAHLWHVKQHSAMAKIPKHPIWQKQAGCNVTRWCTMCVQESQCLSIQKCRPLTVGPKSWSFWTKIAWHSTRLKCQQKLLISCLKAQAAHCGAKNLKFLNQDCLTQCENQEC